MPQSRSSLPLGSFSAAQEKRAPGVPGSGWGGKGVLLGLPVIGTRSHAGPSAPSQPVPGGEPVLGPFAGLWLALSSGVSGTSLICPCVMCR